MRFGLLVRKGEWGTVCWLMGRRICLARKKSQSREKRQREGVMKLIKAELVEDKKKGSSIERSRSDRSVSLQVQTLDSGRKFDKLGDENNGVQ